MFHLRVPEASACPDHGGILRDLWVMVIFTVSGLRKNKDSTWSTPIIVQMMEPKSGEECFSLCYTLISRRLELSFMTPHRCAFSLAYVRHSVSDTLQQKGGREKMIDQCQEVSVQRCFLQRCRTVIDFQGKLYFRDKRRERACIFVHGDELLFIGRCCKMWGVLPIIKWLRVSVCWLRWHSVATNDNI